MLRKIDLHLSELPRAAERADGPDNRAPREVLHIVREMNREFDRDRLLGLILDRAIELTQAERGFVILLQDGKEEVHLARNIDRESVHEPETKVSTWIVREVIRNGRPIISQDAVSDQRFDESLSVRSDMTASEREAVCLSREQKVAKLKAIVAGAISCTAAIELAGLAPGAQRAKLIEVLKASKHARGHHPSARKMRAKVREKNLAPTRGKVRAVLAAPDRLRSHRYIQTATGWRQRASRGQRRSSMLES